MNAREKQLQRGRRRRPHPTPHHPIDSTIIVQESQQRQPEHGWKGEYLRVILSAAKDLVAQRARSFAEFTLSEANGLRMTLGGRFVSPYMLLFSQTLSTKGQQGKALLDTHCRGKTCLSTRLDR